MAKASLKIGGSWATKEDSLLGFNDENGNYKPIPFDFTRATTATRVNRDGLIEEVQSGVPRIDFTDSAGSLLLEPQRTNINTYSDPTDAQKGSTSYASVTYQDDFSWGLGNVINNAIVFEDNSTTRYAYYSSSVTSGTQYTLSVFVKMDDNSTPNPATDFLMVLAGVSFASGYNIEDYGNNIYRVSVSGTASASNTANGVLKIASHSSKGFKVSGFQVEAGSYLTSLIPTSGSAVTRVEDECDNAGNASTFNDSQGTLFAELFIEEDIDSNINISISDGVHQQNLAKFIYLPSSNEFRFETFGASVGTSITINTLSLGVYNKIAGSYDGSNVKLYINGVEIDSVSTNQLPTGLNQFNFDRADGSAPFTGKCKQAIYFPTALTDTELAELTT